MALFAYSTILGWCYYGEKSLEYLAGSSFILPYRILWCLLLPLGATVRINVVWAFADVMNGLMALPNLIGLLVLSGLVAREATSYFKERKKAKEESDWRSNGR